MGGDYKICFNKTNMVHHFWIVVEGSRSVGWAEVWKSESKYCWTMKLDTDWGRKKLGGSSYLLSEVIEEMVFAIRDEFEPDSIQTPEQTTMERIEKSETVQS